jgi:hypothetical protein
MNMSEACMYCDEWRRDNNKLQEEVKDLQQKLLASQAREARLREALGKILVGYSDKYLVEQISTEALSTPPNTAELERFVSESVESEIDKRLGEPVAWSWNNDGVIEYSIDVYAKEYYEKHYGVVMTPLYAKKG